MCGCTGARGDAQGFDFRALALCTGVGAMLRFPMVRNEVRTLAYQVLRFAREDAQGLDFSPLVVCQGMRARLRC